MSWLRPLIGAAACIVQIAQVSPSPRAVFYQHESDLCIQELPEQDVNSEELHRLAVGMVAFLVDAQRSTLGGEPTPLMAVQLERLRR